MQEGLSCDLLEFYTAQSSHTEGVATDGCVNAIVRAAIAIVFTQRLGIWETGTDTSCLCQDSTRAAYADDAQGTCDKRLQGLATGCAASQISGQFVKMVGCHALSSLSFQSEGFE